MSKSRFIRESRQRQHDLLRRAHTINGATLEGIDGKIVEVQARAIEVLEGGSPWNKAVTVAGMPRREANDMLLRIGSALASLGYPLCPIKITLNFHPEGRGTGLDLPAALAIMQAAGLVAPFDSGDYLIFGSLDAHGQVRYTPAALPLSMAAREGQGIVFPEVNGQQCRLIRAVRKCNLIPVSDLEQAALFCRGEVKPERISGQMRVESVQEKPIDFADIIGQERAKRAAEIAAAGGHNLLMVGPPGTGKTLIANAVSGIMPPLDNSEKVDLTRIWSAAGKIDSDGQAVIRRPFRVVHHSATKQSLIGGGGRDVSPGEITLAHLGVLFLDELPEFKPNVLESLRQPLEDGCVRISRVHHKSTLPSQFSLVGAMNPCPCGYAPDCSCPRRVVEKYQSRISGPLMDRIDLKVSLDPVPIDAEPSGETSKEIRARVTKAMHRQRERLRGTGYHSNADVPGPMARKLFRLTEEARDTLRAEAERHQISMRGADRVLKVARTIADLSQNETIEPEHIRESVEFL